MPHHQISRRSRNLIKSFRAQADARRTLVEKIADILTRSFGSMTFLALNALWFAGWIVVNVGWVPGVAPFDPYPFGLLTMVVSLEAIILAIVVLISQNRQTRVQDLGQEIDMQVNIISEREITKIMQLLMLLLKKHQVQVDIDSELTEMLEPTDTTYIEHILAHQLEKKETL